MFDNQCRVYGLSVTEIEIGLMLNIAVSHRANTIVSTLADVKLKVSFLQIYLRRYICSEAYNLAQVQLSFTREIVLIKHK